MWYKVNKRLAVTYGYIGFGHTHIFDERDNMAKKRKPKSLYEEYGKDAIPVLQNSIKDNAERHPLPDRFLIKNGTCGGSVLIFDTQTGRSVDVGLYCYGGVRRVLDALFNGTDDDIVAVHCDECPHKTNVMRKDVNKPHIDCPRGGIIRFS